MQAPSILDEIIERARATALATYRFVAAIPLPINLLIAIAFAYLGGLFGGAASGVLVLLGALFLLAAVAVAFVAWSERP